MTFYIILIVVVLALIVAAYAAWRTYDTRRKTNAAEEQAYRSKMNAVRAWVVSIMSASTPRAVIDIGDGEILKTLDHWGYWPDWSDDIEGLDVARRRLEQARLVVRFEDADQLTQLDMLCDFLWRTKVPDQFDLGFDANDVAGEINGRLAKARAEVDAGESGAVLRFNVIRQSRDWNFVYLVQHGVVPPACPDNWNDLVVTYFRTPSIETFDGFNPNPEDGRVRLMAAQALRNRSLVLGQVVLAYCSKNPSGKRYPYRDEIGDVLLAEVTKMVHAKHDDMGLFRRTATDTA
mgnify:CR=1 FL=1